MAKGLQRHNFSHFTYYAICMYFCNCGHVLTYIEGAAYCIVYIYTGQYGITVQLLQSLQYVIPYVLLRTSFYRSTYIKKCIITVNMYCCCCGRPLLELAYIIHTYVLLLLWAAFCRSTYNLHDTYNTYVLPLLWAAFCRRIPN